ncbi:hypothetical protein R4P64_30865 [Rhodococcus sp. IEGM 1366]|uniref:hypothetical protein n=1 Tax=Rhodococcus sp. IEGM 1366 TaxID=3082223 RepID=UPI00295568BA|nr:hypothetical protein [Rhodococcus sp. IEGM 1366]MDV8070930.1 hypothetical protein [Rhodococcus sp. IEGM 1366]
MHAMIATLFGFAVIDTLDVLLVSVTAAIAYDARSCGKSPWRGGIAFLLGLFTATTLFGIVAVLGLQVSATAFNLTITPEIRYWSELLAGSSECAYSPGSPRPR